MSSPRTNSNNINLDGSITNSVLDNDHNTNTNFTNSITSAQTRSLDQLQILYTNADQFTNKRDDLVAFIAGNEPDLILITEVTPKVHCTSILYLNVSLIFLVFLWF